MSKGILVPTPSAQGRRGKIITSFLLDWRTYLVKRLTPKMLELEDEDQD